MPLPSAGMLPPTVANGLAAKATRAAKNNVVAHTTLVAAGESSCPLRRPPRRNRPTVRRQNERPQQQTSALPAHSADTLKGNGWARAEFCTT